MTRLFVGFGLPKDVTAVLEKAQNGLYSNGLVAPRNFHVTLAFLDEQDDAMIGKIKAALSVIKAGPFALNIEGVGTFGGATPRSVHAEIEMITGLKNLHRKISRAMRELSLDLPHDKYAPHVTLARLDEFGTHDLKQIMSFLSRRVSLKAGPFVVDAFTLYASEQGAEGPVYTPLETYPLDGI